MIECCANCKHCVSSPKNNRYGDIEHFCLVSSYYLRGVNKDRTKITRFSPGGKKLECKYEKREETAKGGSI